MEPDVVIVFEWLPAVLVLAAGLGLVIANRERLRTATIFAAGGFLVLVVGYLGSMIFALNQTRVYESFAGDYDEASAIINTVWIGLTLWECVGLGLLIVGLLVSRPEPALDQPPPPRPGP